MRLLFTIAIGLLITGSRSHVLAQDAGTVMLEVRVFDGAIDVGPEVRVLIKPSDSTADARPIERSPDGRHRVRVPIGRYDVQAVQERNREPNVKEVVNVKWATGLLAQRYPDTGDEHMEVVNFRTGYGAIRIVPGAAGNENWTATVTGVATKAEVKSAGGSGLVALPEGRYDVIVRASSGEKPIKGVEVNTGRVTQVRW